MKNDNNKIIPKKERISCTDQRKSAEQHTKVEEQIISLMLKHPETIREMIDEGVRTESFDPTYQPLVGAIYQEFVSSGHQRKLTRETYKQLLLGLGVKGDLQLDLSVWEKCYISHNVDVNELGQLMRQLRESYCARQISCCLGDFSKDIKQKGYEKAARKLNHSIHQAMTLLDHSPVTQDEDIRVGEYKTAFLDWLKTPSTSIIRSNFKEIDDRMPGGFAPGTLTILVAPPGNHKTNLMTNITRNVSRAGHEVWFYNLEDSGNHIIARIVSRETGMPIHRIMGKQLSPQELGQIEKVWPSDMRLLSPYAAITTRQIEHDLQRADVKPNVVIVDYQNCLAPLTQRAQRNDLEIGETLKELRRLGRRYGFAVITAAQLGRDAIKRCRKESNASPDTADILGSQQYGADADCIFALKWDEEDRHKLKVWTIKARYGSRAPFEMYVNAETCLIADNEAALLTEGAGTDDIW